VKIERGSQRFPAIAFSKMPGSTSMAKWLKNWLSV
jgi:hypothetical protein